MKIALIVLACVIGFSIISIAAIAVYTWYKMCKVFESGKGGFNG